MFSGSIVAIVTPFKDGKVDEKKFRDLIEFQIKNGTSGIVPCGTTGESATLSFDEHERVIEIAIEQTKKRVPVIAGSRLPKLLLEPAQMPLCRFRLIITAPHKKAFTSILRRWPMLRVSRLFSTTLPRAPE
jgi:hypothetical protein